MARLSDHLKYFINQKLSTDESWQKVEIIFSGHEVSIMVIVIVNLEFFGLP